MKKITLVLVAAALSLASFAQRSAIDKVANAACDCINATEISDDMTTSDAELLLGQCMAPSIMENMDALMKEMKLKEFNQETGYQIGIEVGKKLAVDCPKFIELSLVIARNTRDEALESEYEEEPPVEIEESSEALYSVQGKFIRMEGAAQRYIVVRAENGEEKFLWLYWFDGSDDILADPNYFVNHEVYIEFMSIDIFDGVKNEYVPTKVLLSVLANE